MQKRIFSLFLSIVMLLSAVPFQVFAEETPEEVQSVQTEAPASEESEAPAPEESEASVPEESEAAVPEESEASVPEESEASVPEESEAAVPEESEAAVPEESEPLVLEEIEAPTDEDADMLAAALEETCVHEAGEGVYENVVETTCTQDGSQDLVFYCTLCGEELSRGTESFYAYGHIPGEPGDDGSRCCVRCGEALVSEYPEGSYSNPIWLKMGENSVELQADSYGYFAWLASGEGTLTVTMLNDHWYCSIESENAYTYANSSNESGNPLTIELAQGEEVSISVSNYNPEEGNNPGGLVRFTAAFTEKEELPQQPVSPEIPEGTQTVDSGSCGDDLTWEVLLPEGSEETNDAPYILIISGQGAMEDYDTSYYSDYEDGVAPWARYPITRVVVEEGVTTIGSYAFDRIVPKDANAVSLPEGLLSIGEGAFYNRDKLTYIDLPDSLTYIGPAAFYRTNLSKIEIPQGVTVIEENTFRYCYKLRSVVLPSGLTAIEDAAFEHCRELVNIDLPDSVTTLGNLAFHGCSEMDVSLPKSLTSIGSYCFEESGLTKAVIPNGVTEIKNNTFGSSYSLVAVVLPAHLTYIGSSAFESTNISSIRIPDSVTFIGKSAFAYCDELKNVRLPESLTKIEGSTFDSCYSLEEIVIPEAVTEIGGSAFSSCNLTGVNLPAGLTKVGSYAFYGCDLVTVTLPAGMTEIGESAFNGSGLKFISIPANITSIDSYAFNCYQLESIRFEGDPVSIAENAFPNVTALVSYPASNENWTEEHRQNYGGTLTWVTYCTCTDVVYVEKKYANCVEDGTDIAYWYCPIHDCAWLDEACTQVVDYKQHIQPKNEDYHGWLQWETVTEPTASRKGTMKRVCRYCGLEQTTELSLLTMGKNTATFQENGYTEIYFTWTAQEDGQLKLKLPTGYWEFVYENRTTFDYDYFWCEGEDAANTVEKVVSAQDEIWIILYCYGDMPDAPIEFEAEFVSMIPDGEYQLSTPTNLQWHKTYGWFENEDGGWDEMLKDKTGSLVWSPGYLDADWVQLTVYKDGKKWFDTPFQWNYNGAAYRADYGAYDLTRVMPLESGEYYFTLQAIPSIFDSQSNAKPSEIAVSDVWTYVAPKEKLPTVTNLRWEPGNMACWDVPEGLDCEIEVRFTYAPTATAEPISSASTILKSDASFAELSSWFIENCGRGYYSFTVRLVSPDISVICSGDWAERCGPIVPEGLPQDRVEISCDVTQIQGGKSAKLSGWSSAGGKLTWYLAQGDEAYAKLKASGNTATVTALDITESHTVTVYATTADGLAVGSYTIELLPQVKLVSLYEIVYDGDGDPIYYESSPYPIFTDEIGEDGYTLEMRAIVQPYSADNTITWSTSNQNVATVDENGLVTFTGKTGTVTVTATAVNGVKASCTKTVMEPVYAEAVGETELHLMGGQSATLKIVNADTGRAITGKNVYWFVSMDASAYASISASGKLTTRKVMEPVSFSVYAYAVMNGFSIDYVEYQVNLYPAVQQIEISQDGKPVTAGQTLPFNLCDTQQMTISAGVLPANAMNAGLKVEISDKNNKYADYRVDAETGTVIIENPKDKNGTVTVKFTAQDGSRKNASVKIQFARFATDVEILHEETTLVSGQSMTLNAQAVPDDLTKSGVTWTLKDPAQKSIAKLSGTKLTAQKVFEETPVTLVATSKDGKASEECVITILPKDPEAPAIYEKYREEYVTGQTLYVDLSQKDRDVWLQAENFSGDEVTWTVKGGAATYEVREGDLIVFMQKAGSVTVTAKSGSGSATVTLKAANLATYVNVSVKKDKAPVIASGKTLELQAEVLDRNDRPASGKKVTWSIVSGQEYASINASGKVTAAKNLTSGHEVLVRATATDGSDVCGEITLQVKPLATGIQIYTLEADLEQRTLNLTNSGWLFNRSNTNLVWDMGADQGFKVYSTVYPWSAEDDSRNASQEVTWKSSTPKVASIDSEGNITCLKPGTTTITCTTADGSNQKVTFKLTVIKRITSLTLSAGDIVGGKTLSLKPIVEPADANAKQFYWAIGGDTAFAKIDQKGKLTTGKVTAPKTVWVYAYAMDGSGAYAETQITIWPKAVSKVELWSDGGRVTGKTLSAEQGDRIPLDVILDPEYNTCPNVTWKSSDPEAASVDEDGTVTVHQSGKTVTITCTATDGSNKKATVKIKIAK